MEILNEIHNYPERELPATASSVARSKLKPKHIKALMSSKSGHFNSRDSLLLYIYCSIFIRPSSPKKKKIINVKP